MSIDTADIDHDLSLETYMAQVSFELDNRTGNKSGVGTKIIIAHGKSEELHQLRELKLSGGYQSFDPLIAHFV